MNTFNEMDNLLLGKPFLSFLPASSKQAWKIICNNTSLLDPVNRTADTIHHYLNKVDQIVIVTGFPDNDYHTTFDIEGPIGAFNLISLFSVFQDTKDIKIILSADNQILDKLCAAASTLNESNFTPLPIRSLPDLSHSLLITSNVPGRNIAGVFHTKDGFSVTKTIYPLENIIDASPPRFWLTIGSGGSEIGLGKFIRSFPLGNMCNCPCQQGISSNKKANKTILSVTSNLGALILSVVLAKRNDIKWKYSWKKENEILSVLNKENSIEGTRNDRGTFRGISSTVYRMLIENVTNLISTES